jgi:putative ABC transport system permease protein
VQKLFGIPMGDLAVGLAIVLGLAIGVIAALALRNRFLLRLGLRNLVRRRGRAALIVAGLMLGTTIIASALVTGDTMNRTVRASVIESLGPTDELVAVRGTDPEGQPAMATSSSGDYFPQDAFGPVERALRRSKLVDGVAPAIVEPVALQDRTSRRTEARVSLFAADPSRMRGFGTIRSTRGDTVSLADLADGEVYLDRDAAEELDASPGDRVLVLAGSRTTPSTVADVVDFDGAGSDGAAVLLPLERAQPLLGRATKIRYILVSNRGDDVSGAALTDDGVAAAGPAVAAQGLEIQRAKQDGLKEADAVSDVFVSVFTTFGSFSIAAGILLIFLIFVMLSAERRSELGIARAVGTRRGHLVQLFVFEGLAYDLGAALVGAALGVGVAFAMVTVMAGAFDQTGLEVRHAVTLRSLVVAYALGVLFTLVVVALSAWRVSRLNIVAAVRSQPEPLAPRRSRRGAVLGAAGLAVGLLMMKSGLDAAQATPFAVGVSLAIVSLVPLARAAGLSERIAFTVAGMALVTWWLLPFETMNAIAGRHLDMDFSAWTVSGLMVVAGVTWVIVYNADIVLGLGMRVLGRIRGLAPVVKMSMAYPLRGRFRTGITLAMFTLVVFTIAVGATTSRAFLSAVDDPKSFSGGFEVRAEVAPGASLTDPGTQIRATRGMSPLDFDVVAGEAVVPGEARQSGTRSFASYPVRGFDLPWLAHTQYGLAARARGYDTPREVWDAIGRKLDLAVVDPFTVPRHSNWNFAPPPDFRLSGFFLEDKVFDPVRVEVRDPRTGTTRTLTVIGVLSDTVPQDMPGIWTSEETATAVFGPRAALTIHHIALAPGVDPQETARALERTFLASGMEAKSARDRLHETIGPSYTLNWLLLGFMGLGLVVGVAALGVISARSVVERRQQIGVLRAIGFQRGMVQLAFLLEASFVALTSIVVGSALGLIVARNVIADSADQPSYQGALHFSAPWGHLAIVFVVVFAAALLTTLAPAARAARVRPAEALRYE